MGTSPSEPLPHEVDPYFKLKPPGPVPPDELCDCAGDGPVELMCALGYNPVHCVRCNREVPPEALAPDPLLVEALQRFNTCRRALEWFWLDSGEYEDWAVSELTDLESYVNRIGLEVRGRVDRLRRCYYRYFEDESVDDYEPRTTCPSCGGDLEDLEGSRPRSLVCEPCGLILWGLEE